MKVKEISLSVRRSVRHEQYIMSHVECTLTAEMEDLTSEYQELHGDVLVIVEEMVEKEKEDYEKTKRVSKQPKINVPF